jgi:type II secretory pathway predicted ATPase ExeA
MNQRLLALYGLKWNPFSPELPTEAIFVPPKLEDFCWRIEHAQIREGGFAMIHGDPGTGKSIALRLLAERLSRLVDVTVGAVNHPQSNLADFYRELGDIFAVALRPHNRWGGFKALRERWLAHLDTTRRRCVLLIDEAQEMSPAVLCELRLLASARFDSQPLLCVVLAGDARLVDKLRREELIPLGSRIRTRLATGVATRDELLACLEQLLATAGNAGLMTPELRHTLVDHAAGNYRICIGPERARSPMLPPRLPPAAELVFDGQSYTGSFEDSTAARPQVDISFRRLSATAFEGSHDAAGQGLVARTQYFAQYSGPNCGATPPGWPAETGEP